ncbi:hypothetical protein V7793_33680, partial [Streptomyces sp. KLMMK]
WRAGGDPALRLVECASLLMLAAFLVSRPSFQHYMLVVLPSLAASLVVRAAAARSAWLWLPLLPEAAGVSWPHLETARRHAFRDVVLITGVTAALALHAWRTRSDPSGEVTVSARIYALSNRESVRADGGPPECARDAPDRTETR